MFSLYFQSEDDGVILSTMLFTQVINQVGLLIIDAKDFVELGRAIFETPGPTPKCLHGWFLPQNMTEN